MAQLFLVRHGQASYGAADYDQLRRYQDMGVARLVVSLDSLPAETMIPELDRWAELIRRFA